MLPRTNTPKTAQKKAPDNPLIIKDFIGCAFNP